MTGLSDAEPFALVQIFAQPVAAAGQPDDPIVLAGEAAGRRRGQLRGHRRPVRPAGAAGADRRRPPGRRQLHHHGPCRSTWPATSAGPGSSARPGRWSSTAPTPTTTASTTRHGDNQEGWFYMQQVLENIQPERHQRQPGAASPLGATPSEHRLRRRPRRRRRRGRRRGRSSAPSRSPPAGAGLDPGLIDDGDFGTNTSDLNGNGRNDLDEYLGGLPVVAQGSGGPTGTTPVTVPGVRLGGTGVLYVTTANNSSGDIDSRELAVVNNHGLDIATSSTAAAACSRRPRRRARRSSRSRRRRTVPARWATPSRSRPRRRTA